MVSQAAGDGRRIASEPAIGRYGNRVTMPSCRGSAGAGHGTAGRVAAADRRAWLGAVCLWPWAQVPGRDLTPLGADPARRGMGRKRIRPARPGGGEGQVHASASPRSRPLQAETAAVISASSGQAGTQATAVAQSPDGLSRTVINTQNSSLCPAPIAESGDLIAVPIAWAVAYRLSIKGVGGSSLVCDRVSRRGRERWSSASAGSVWAGSVGLAPGAVGSLGAVPGCQVWRALSARRQCSVTV